MTQRMEKYKVNKPSSSFSNIIMDHFQVKNTSKQEAAHERSQEVSALTAIYHRQAATLHLNVRVRNSNAILTLQVLKVDSETT